jgi:apolipoprotein N-acyltransferase
LTLPVPREVLAVASGILLALSFPKFGHGAVAWVALAPLLVALPGASPAQGARLGYLTGATSALGLLYWTSLVVVQFGGLPLFVGIGVMLLLCLAFALFPLLFGALMALFLRAFGTHALYAAPAVWVGTELLRAHTFFEFPWCLLGYSQHANPAALQIASLTAVYGVSAALVLSGALLAHAALVPAARRACFLGLFGLLAGLHLYGALVMRAPLQTAGRLRVGLVQGGIVQEDKWRPELARQNVGQHLELTRQAAAQGARLVVWPESAVPFYYDHSPALAEELRETTRRHGVYLFFGNDDREISRDGRDRVYVGAKLLAPEGTLALRYHKMQLVPFGEYVPLQPLLTLGGRVSAKLVEQVADFTPGGEAVVGAVDGHPVGGFICYESVFPHLVRRFTAGGASLLVNMTNDAWYGRTSAPHQHLAMTVLRAVENRRTLVRAANTGITAVIDPYGRVRERTALFARTVVVADVDLVTESTFYARHGDVFAGACLGATAVLAGLVLAGDRKTSRGSKIDA